MVRLWLRIKKNLNNIIGHNFRLGEIEAAIGIEQYNKLKKIIRNRQILCRRLTKGLNNLEGLGLPQDNKFRTHNYYIYPIILNLKKIKFKQIKNSKITEK